MRYSSATIPTCLAAFVSLTTAAALPKSAPAEVARRSPKEISIYSTLDRRQFDPYISSYNPYNPCTAGCLNLNDNNNDDQSSGSGSASGSTSGSGSSSDSSSGSSPTAPTGPSYTYANSTYGVVEDGWMVTPAVAGYNQDIAAFSGTLSSGYSDMTDVWYSNNPNAYAVFTPPVNNVVAMYLFGSTKSDRGDFYFALQDVATGNITYGTKASAYSSTTDTGLHVLYGAEGLDPAASYKLVVMNDFKAATTNYLAVQGVTVTSQTKTSSIGGRVTVSQDSSSLYPVAGRSQTDTVATFNAGPAPPYTLSTNASASGTSSTTGTSNTTVGNGGSRQIVGALAGLLALSASFALAC
ncbi:hypothetical protein JCM11251_007542 [Rhodosporidiobolus azoricus]